MQERPTLIARKLDVERLLATQYRHGISGRKELIAEQTQINRRLSAIKGNSARMPSMTPLPHHSERDTQHAAVEFAKAALIANCGTYFKEDNLAESARIAWEMSDIMMLGWEERFGQNEDAL